MPGPQTPAIASETLPPITWTPFVDQNGLLTPAALNLIQQLWAGVFGGGNSFINQLPQPGDLKAIAGATPSEGWLLCDGTAYLTDTYPALFAAIGTTWGTSGAGTFKVPDLRGRLPLGVDATHALGDTGGTLSLTLTEANLPNYELPVTDPGHNHVIVDPGHAHAVTDPGHVHTITDPGHHHTLGSNPTSTDTTGTDPGTSTGSNTGTSTTGITVNSATTGLTVNTNTTGITDNDAFTGITVASGGSGTPLDTTPPFGAVNWLIKF